MNNSTIDSLLTLAKDKSLDDEQLAELAVSLAAKILTISKGNQTLSERYQDWKMTRMMEDSMGKTLTLTMADQVFRPPSEARSASQFRYLIDEYGVPTYLPIYEQIAMKVGAVVSLVAPDIVMPAVTHKMRNESSKVILPSEHEELAPHIKKRRKQGIKMNINQLGEAVLGEEEAERRIQQVIARLEDPHCEYISVKISAIFSQIHLLAYRQTLDEIKKRLRLLYRTAQNNTFKDTNGQEQAKFVNLDMEEYKDLHLTCDAFKQVLMEEAFLHLKAGIVLQAYLPDSYEIMKDLTHWAQERVRSGGGCIKIRIVKGANLAMERVDASIHGWELATYPCKADVDANYKRMVHFGCQPDHAKCVHLGIGSHNLFEISYAMLLRAHYEVEPYVEFEMLEGMANHQARAVKGIIDGLLLYAPVVKEEDFHSAIAYLVRRLDENTAEENFLHDLFGMRYGDSKWGKQREMFLNSCLQRDQISSQPNRLQNRSSESLEGLTFISDGEFSNAPDTDWALPHNAQWILDVVRDYGEREIEPVPMQIAGEFIFSEQTEHAQDPSRPGMIAYHYSVIDAAGIDRAFQCAVDAQPAWGAKSIDERSRILKQVAIEIAQARGECIATMVMDAGKAAPEADSEISEAIDFANYYSESLSDQGFFDGTQCEALGTIVVTPPWNFPFAIPCGGILAALMAGNTVILKPAPEAVLTSWKMVQLLWQAGIPREALQFVMCGNHSTGKKLITDSRVAGVILTGGYATARMFQSWKPDMRLYAETSGKNSLIITSAADTDQAIKDLVHSAFGHAGQKCSAASLAIIEADIYDSPDFRRQLRDAAASLQVGSSWDPASIVTPIIRPPSEDLYRAFNVLEKGETWLLEPKNRDGNPCLWSPGVKLGIKPYSWYRHTECFGPVLGVIRADNLEHAIRIQNESEFGLTGGIHTLDKREIAIWKHHVEVGNAYINRSTTGAIVQRQPFGGWKKSCFGPGAKAGGENYLTQFVTWSQKGNPQKVARISKSVRMVLDVIKNKLTKYHDILEASAASYSYWWEQKFSKEHDPSQLHGESNIFRYRPHKYILLCATGMSDLEVVQIYLAATTCGVSLDISTSKASDLIKSLPVNVYQESENLLNQRILEHSTQYDSLRAIAVSSSIHRSANNVSLKVVTSPPLANGRIELLAYLREQSISEQTHRYGNIILTAGELAQQEA